MIKRSNRAALIAILALCACMFIGIGVWLHGAKSNRLSALRQELAEKQAQVENVRAKVKQMPELETKYGTLRQQVAVLEPALPTEAYIPTFLSQIQTLAVQTNNRIALIKPKPKRAAKAASPAPATEEDVTNASGNGNTTAGSSKSTPSEIKSPYEEVDIELGFEGTYWSTLEFLEKLRAFPKMIAVNELAMKPKSSFGDATYAQEPLLDVTVQLTAVIAEEK